jgi:hypothetical protein
VHLISGFLGFGVSDKDVRSNDNGDDEDDEDVEETTTDLMMGLSDSGSCGAGDAVLELLVVELLFRFLISTYKNNIRLILIEKVYRK